MCLCAMSPEINARAALLDLPRSIGATIGKASLAAGGLAQNSVAVPAKHNRLRVAKDGGAGEPNQRECQSHRPHRSAWSNAHSSLSSGPRHWARDRTHMLKQPGHFTSMKKLLGA